jgi:trehalose/maltose hydrolase-like predicted phosphorylase
MDEQEQDTGETPKLSPADELLMQYLESNAFKNLMAKHGLKMLRSIMAKHARAEKKLALQERFAQHGRQYRKNWHVS